MNQYGGLFETLKTYWKDYGGWRDFVQSPLLHISAVIAILAVCGLLSIEWRSLSIGMMPTILGFSLAAYAITFSLMGSSLHSALAKSKDVSGKSLAISVNATFFHNVFVQSACLSFSVISNGSLVASLILRMPFESKTLEWLVNLEVRAGGLIGTFLLVYAVILLFSSTIAMFRLGRLAPISQPNDRSVAANDKENVEVSEVPARELYGFRWKVIRFVAKLLRVDG